MGSSLSRATLAACALLSAAPARAEEPATVTAGPRFLEPRVRAGLFVAASVSQVPQGAAGPMLSAAAIFNQWMVVDLSGLFLPLPDGPVGFGALQAGPMLRFGGRGPEGAGLTLDLRAMLGGAVGTQRTTSAQTVLTPAGIAGVGLEGTRWFDRSWGLSGDLAANVVFTADSDLLWLVRVSVGLAF